MMQPVTGREVIAGGLLHASDLQSMPVLLNRYYADTTARLVDVGRLLLMDSETAITFCIPPDDCVDYAPAPDRGFLLGTHFVVCRFGTGTVSFNAGEGVTLLSANSALSIAAQYQTAVAVKIAANTWLVMGNLSAT